MTTKNSEASVNMKEIARLAGVSQGAVSAILRNDRSSSIRFSQKTYDRVMDIARQFRFRPDFSGRALISGKLNSVGILVHKWRFVSREIYQGISDCSVSNNQLLIMGILPPEDFKKDPAYIPRILSERSTDGLIILDDIPEHLVSFIDELKIPAVWINTSRRTDGNCITYDESGAMMKAAEYFMSIDKRHILYLGPARHDGHYSHKERIQGITEAAAKLGLPAPLIPKIETPSENQGEGRAQVLKQRADYLTRCLNENQAVNACVVNDPDWGAALYRAAETAGKDIPGDISVISIHREKQVYAMNPMLSFLSMNRFDAGERGVKMLLNLIEGKGIPEEPTVLEYSLVHLESS